MTEPVRHHYGFLLTYPEAWLFFCWASSPWWQESPRRLDTFARNAIPEGPKR